MITMKTISTEYGGTYTQIELDEILDFLCNMAEIAQNSEDFVRKVEFGITDETSRVSDRDRMTLRDWYFVEYPKISAA